MKKVLIGVVAASALLLAGGAQASAELAKNSGCLNCHTVDTKLVGPALKEVAAKYADKPDASEYLTDKIIKGSSGVWGPVPMPANNQVSEAEARTLVKWILSQK